MKVWAWAIGLLAVIITVATWLSAAGGAWPTSVSPVGQSQNDNQEPVIQGLTPKTNRADGPPKVIVPILMYHYIRDYQNPDDYLGIALSVAPQTFERQLQTLKKAGYFSITLEAFAEGKASPPPNSSATKPIILTFDDGYEDHFTEALPILRQHGFIGTFFIVSGFIGRPFYLTSNQLRQLSISGMELGGHSVNHKNLANLGYEGQIEEIADGQRNRSPVFAYPAGQYSPTTLDVLDGLRVKAAVTTNFGLATDLSDLLELPRIRVKETTDLLKLIKEETAKLQRSVF